jgi:hypothetical protein
MVFVLVLSGTVGGSSALASSNPRPDAVNSGRTVVYNLVNGQYNAIVSQFNARLRRELTAGRLAQQWQSWVQSLGAYRYEEGFNDQKVADGTAVMFRCKMERGSVDIDIVFADDGTIAGLTIVAANFSRHIKPPT